MQQYVVKPNDTLFLIAKEFDVPLAQLIKANPQIENPNLIYEGQTIIIPDMPSIPEQIAVVETEAMNVIEDIIMGDWDSAYDRINVIRTAMNNLTPILREAEVPNNVITGMTTAIRTLEQNILQRRTFSALSQANRITQLIADALDFFNVIIPTDLRRLAFFARQMIINVEQNDWNEALQNYRRAMTVWERIRPELEEAYGTDVMNFNQVMNDILASIDRRDYQTAINNAVRMLELINVLADRFEQMYT
jgi:LysM repeat protein